MAKYGRISNSGRPDDGLFEVVSCLRRGWCHVALMILRAATVGLGKAAEGQPLRIRYHQGHSIQIDGEVMHADGNSEVALDCVSHALTTVG
jgi:diacylglycerol kinase (ATP)